VTKVTQIKCPKCNTPIFYKYVDSVFLCDNCGTMHVRDAGIETLEMNVGRFTRQGDGERVYRPFWVASVTFQIDDLKIEGGGLSNLFGLLSGQSKQGTILMYIPAYETEAMDFKDTAMRREAHPGRPDIGRIAAHRRVPVRHGRGGEAGRPAAVELPAERGLEVTAVSAIL
jgi:hypothetical protein